MASKVEGIPDVDLLREARGRSGEDASVRVHRSGHDLADLGGVT